MLDYRASPSLASGSTQFTLDDIAKYDYPAAVDKVREVSGAESVQVMAHCIGSLTMLMSLALGLKGVRHAVASQVTLHPRAGALNEMRAGIYAGNALQALGVDTLTTDRDDLSWAERLYERALQLYPSGEEECGLPFCRRVMFMYGEVYDHDQLNDATHEHLHEAFGVANMTTFRQITRDPPRGPRRHCRRRRRLPARRPTTCGCRSRSCTARTTGSSRPRAAS